MNNENYFCENLNEFFKQSGKSQRKLAEELNVSVASINNYLKGVSEPSLSFLIGMKQCYQINIDDFLCKKLNNKIYKSNSLETYSKENLGRFIGNYMLYYFDSGSHKGKISTTSGALKYGVISVYGFGTNKKHLLVEASFIKDKVEAEKLKMRLDKATTSKDILSIHGENNQNYSGVLDMSFAQFFISIKSVNYEDRTLMIFNNPPSSKEYIGGMGTVNSISRGREHMPCVQYVLLARDILNVPEGEIYNMLLLDVGEVNVKNEAEQLIKLFKNLYLDEKEQTLKLEEFQKTKIIENSLQSIIENSIESNMFRYAKVSGSEDDDFYRILKSNR